MKSSLKLFTTMLAGVMVFATACSGGDDNVDGSSSESYSGYSYSTPGISTTDSYGPSTNTSIDSTEPEVKVITKTLNYNFYSKFKEEDSEDTYDPVVPNEEDRPDLSLFYDKNGVKTPYNKISNMTIKGDFVEIDYLNRDAYFFNNSNASFTFERITPPSHIYDQDDYEYTLFDDEAVESALDNKIGIVHYGCFIVLKSYDNGLHWIYENASYVNVGAEKITYTPSGEDITKGTLYRFFYGYKLKTTRVVGTRREWWHPWDELDDTRDFYATVMQESICYVGSNVIGAGFYSEDVAYTGTVPEGYETELINSFSTLVDGSVSYGDVTYKRNNQDYLICQYRYNDGDVQYASNEQVFSEEGKYEFEVKNVLGTKQESTIYIVDQKTLFTSYFGAGLLPDSKRIYDVSSLYPVYMKGTPLNFNDDATLPPITGYVYNALLEDYSSKPLMQVDNKVLASNLVLDPGSYIIELVAGGIESSGQKIMYRFSFKIADRPDYKPVANYALLKASSRKLNIGLSAYATNFETTKGGSYVFLFPLTIEGYKQAETFAYDIQKRFVKEYKDSKGKPYYYYHGIRYDSKIDLYAKMKDDLKDAVYTSFINPLEAYGVDIISEDTLENIEETVLEHDVRVCVDLKTRDALVTSDILINGFSFAQVAEYESSSLHIIGEGVDKDFDYDTKLDDILTKSGSYVITESNWNGSRTYEVNYIAPNELTASLSFYTLKNDVKTNYTVKKGDVLSSYQCDLFSFQKSSDPLDSQTLVTVSAPSIGYRAVTLLSKAWIVIPTLTEKATYTIEVVNRLGTSFEFSVEVSGNYDIEEDEYDD